MKSFDSFPYDQASIDELERVLSKERLSTYLKLTRGDRAAAIRLQAWNMALSEALYGPIQMLAVALRNAIHDRLRSRRLQRIGFSITVDLRKCGKVALPDLSNIIEKSCNFASNACYRVVFVADLLRKWFLKGLASAPEWVGLAKPM